MKRLIAIAVVGLAACGDNLGSDDVTGDDAGPSPWHQDVVHTGAVPILAAEVLSDGRIAVLEAEAPADDAPRCPDCETMMIPDDECPAACARASLSLQWIEADGSEGSRVPLDRFAIGPTAELIGSASVADVGDGSIDLAWTRCLGAPGHSCGTYRASLDASDVLTVMGDPVLKPRVGSVTLIRDRAGRESLVRGWPDPYPFSLPIRVELVDGDAAPVLLGSSEALMPSPSVTPQGTYLFVEDRSPGVVDASCPPCPSFVDCAIGAWPPPGSDCVWGATQEGGLGRIELDGGAAATTPVVSLPRGDGVVLKVEQLTAASGAWPTAIIDAEERGIIVAQERDDGWHTWDHDGDPRFWFTARGTGWGRYRRRGDRARLRVPDAIPARLRVRRTDDPGPALRRGRRRHRVPVRRASRTDDRPVADPAARNRSARDRGHSRGEIRRRREL